MLQFVEAAYILVWCLDLSALSCDDYRHRSRIGLTIRYKMGLEPKVSSYNINLNWFRLVELIRTTCTSMKTPLTEFSFHPNWIFRDNFLSFSFSHRKATQIRCFLSVTHTRVTHKFTLPNSLILSISRKKASSKSNKKNPNEHFSSIKSRQI